MEKEHLNQLTLSKKAKIPQPTIQRILASESKNPRKTSLEPIAAYFNLTIDELKNRPLYQNETGKYWATIPIIDLNQVSEWLSQDATEHQFLIEKTYIPTNKTVSDRAFALKANSSDVHYYVRHPEHVVDVFLLCDPAMSPKDNDFVLIKLDGHNQLIFRQLIFDIDQPFTKPLKQDLAGRLVPLAEKNTILATIFEIRICY